MYINIKIRDQHAKLHVRSLFLACMQIHFVILHILNKQNKSMWTKYKRPNFKNYDYRHCTPLWAWLKLPY